MVHLQCDDVSSVKCKVEIRFSILQKFLILEQIQYNTNGPAPGFNHQTKHTMGSTHMKAGTHKVLRFDPRINRKTLFMGMMVLHN